jgi:hypothetical protein
MAPALSRPAPAGSKRLPKPRVDATMPGMQGEPITEKQPGSRFCVVCGIEVIFPSPALTRRRPIIDRSLRVAGRRRWRRYDV